MALKLISNLSKFSLCSKYMTTCRILHTNIDPSKSTTMKGREATQIRDYMLDRYVNYIKNYDKILEKRFPKAMNAYRGFMVGLKEFYYDLKYFMKIVRILNSPGKSYHNLTRKELELYNQMPRDMLKVAPVLLIGTLPLSNYVVLPLIVYFPRQLLCSHFWNLQQRQEFSIVYLEKRLEHQRPVFRHLQLHLNDLKDNPLHKKWGNILGLLGSGVQPSTIDILECKELFLSKPYHLIYLKGNHIKHLAKIHGIPGFWFRSSRLQDLANILFEMDKAIMKEGGVHNMLTDSLRKACLIRGLNPSNMRNEDLIQWLNQWIEISISLDKNYSSLLLHCPILLSYNHPSNWTLLYSQKT